MIAYEAGGLVKSLAGHDKDQYFIILEECGEYVTLVDGISRKLDNPKRKNKKHVQPTHQKDDVLNKKFVNGLFVTDEEIRAVVRKAEKKAAASAPAHQKLTKETIEIGGEKICRNQM